MKSKQQKLAPEAGEALLAILKDRFKQHPRRHEGIAWEAVQARLEAAPGKLWSLEQMEATGGEPDVIGEDTGTGDVIFCDCSAESPKGRRSLCYDRDGLESRKEHRPANSAVDLAAEMGIALLDEEEYRQLQHLGTFDAKTSSWLRTPDAVRELGGALFGDFRFGRVFTYHNGAQSYYGSRAFRGLLRV